MSYAKFKLGDSRPRKRQPQTKKIQQMSMSLLNDMDRKWDHQHHSVGHHQQSQNLIACKTQPDDSYSQLTNQHRKLNDIQQSYQKFKSSQHITHVSNKENNDNNFPMQPFPLQDRFYKPQIVKNDPQLQELKEIIHQLQARDASQRLDIANLKKQNNHLQAQIQLQQKQIQDLERIQKRDNDYILKIDKTIMLLKDKLAEAQKGRQFESNKNSSLLESLQNLQEENAYLQSYVQNYQQSMTIEHQKQPYISSGDDLSLTEKLWENNHQKPLAPINIQMINKSGSETQTPTVKVSQLLHNSSCAKNNSLLDRSHDSCDADEALKQFLGSLDQQQASQIYSILSQIVEEESKKGNNSLNNSVIYERLVNKILQDNNEHEQEEESSRNNSKDCNTFKCGSSMSNFSFAVNSERKKLKLGWKAKGQENDDCELMQHMASLSQSLAAEEHEQLKQKSALGKRRENNSFEGFVQTQLNSSSTEDYNERDQMNSRHSTKNN